MKRAGAEVGQVGPRGFSWALESCHWQALYSAPGGASVLLSLRPSSSK